MATSANVDCRRITDLTETSAGRRQDAGYRDKDYDNASDEVQLVRRRRQIPANRVHSSGAPPTPPSVGASSTLSPVSYSYPSLQPTSHGLIPAFRHVQDIHARNNHL